MRPPLAAALALAVLLLPVAQAFTSVPPGSSAHDEVTAVAADAGWSKAATEALQQAVREPDYQENELDPDGTDVDRIDATEAYRPWHHCDREPPATDAEAFNLTVAYIQEQRAEALAKARAGDGDGAVAALGRALHAVQDCYSHSNIVDMPDQAAAHEDAVLHGGTAVNNLRLTGYVPGADEPEDPEGDPYPHKDYAKDDAGKNDEAKAPAPGGANETKFEAAVSLARMATVAFLQEFSAELAPAERETVLGVREEDGGLPDDVNVPGPGAVAALLAVALAAAGVRRR